MHTRLVEGARVTITEQSQLEVRGGLRPENERVSISYEFEVKRGGLVAGDPITLRGRVARVAVDTRPFWQDTNVAWSSDAGRPTTDAGWIYGALHGLAFTVELGADGCAVVDDVSWPPLVAGLPELRGRCVSIAVLPCSRRSTLRSKR